MAKKVTEIQNKYGFLDFNAAVHYAVAQTHKTEFRDYVMAKQEKSKKEIPAIKKQKSDAQKLICDELSGTVLEDGGVLYCQYHTYSRKNRYAQKIPLSDLSEKLVPSQFLPSKEVVKEMQANGEINYKNE
ncbi:MAG: hypothetical protein GWP06_12500 [Actinobacteria bacterium]|nr:hypothetical protein [Actinomycetota bacterium]